ncbi:glutaredoxin family protein [Hoyosella altamirensis]|uniref:Glutaredoxin-like protein NrdH n=1 Tax=Hoyosella altamirensis TaxID=616997 RepID=A0A839RTF1_9ACTN|nr:glutaredoxin family protein [Hoyosella altamirensis]MBB3040155.1 glutaredoxin-like protein NrdH [Hoyosella altamirensis]
MHITVYSSPGCMPCFGTKRALTKHGVPFTEVDVTTDPSAVEQITALDPEYKSTPVVVVLFDDGTIDHWHGLRDNKLQALAYLAAEAAV